MGAVVLLHATALAGFATLEIRAALFNLESAASGKRSVCQVRHAGSIGGMRVKPVAQALTNVAVGTLRTRALTVGVRLTSAARRLRNGTVLTTAHFAHSEVEDESLTIDIRRPFPLATCHAYYFYTAKPLPSDA